MARRVWKRGDWVRCVETGHTFQVQEFSVMDGLEDWPRTPNPDQSPGSPLYVRWCPDLLEEASALDRLATTL